jgi:hypothetical protein
VPILLDGCASLPFDSGLLLIPGICSKWKHCQLNTGLSELPAAIGTNDLAVYFTNRLQALQM